MRAWAWQKALVRRRLAALDAGQPQRDELLLLQHAPVYTLGTGSTPANLRFDPAAPPFELHRTERGGEATYHGPGQLVLYPILDLKYVCVCATKQGDIVCISACADACVVLSCASQRKQAAHGGPALVHALAGGGGHPRAGQPRPGRWVDARSNNACAHTG